VGETSSPTLYLSLAFDLCGGVAEKQTGAQVNGPGKKNTERRRFGRDNRRQLGCLRRGNQKTAHVKHFCWFAKKKDEIEDEKPAGQPVKDQKP